MTVDWLIVGVSLAIVLGIVGIVVPVLPGLLLVYGGVAVWSFMADDPERWMVLGAATLVLVGSQVFKYLIPQRRLVEAGVPSRSTVFGLVLGIVGFFVVPVVGLFLGFVVGVFLAELLRLGSAAVAWPSTIEALKAVGLSIVIELLAALVLTAAWLAAVVVD